MQYITTDSEETSFPAFLIAESASFFFTSLRLSTVSPGRGVGSVVGMRTCTCAQDVIQFFTRVQITFFGKYDHKYWPIIFTCTRSRDTANRYIMNQTEIFLTTVKRSCLVGRNQLEIHWRKTSSGKGMCELCIFYSSAPVFVDFARRFFNIHLKLEN